MNTRLHKLARTTPAIRAEMALSADSVAVLACRHGVSESTARKWKGRKQSTRPLAHGAQVANNAFASSRAGCR